MGPSTDCGVGLGVCDGMVLGQELNASWDGCKAFDDHYSRPGHVNLMARAGTHWARQTAQPGYVQYRFPVPPGAGGVSMRLTLDARYTPEARGGNPCAAAKANASHQCNLCTSGPWDHTSKPGWYVHSLANHVSSFYSKGFYCHTLFLA